MKKTKPQGVLKSMLARIDGQSLAKTRKRMLIAMKIDTALHEKGLTQKQFAQKMGKTESEISDWLSGNRNFTSDTLMDIEQALDINLLNTTRSHSVVVPESGIAYRFHAEKIVVLKVENSQWFQPEVSGHKQYVGSNLLVD
ncbi:MAG: helix-turn-helix domain-containing protein [Prevotella sp.]|jgi:transcriptional regulator with XRE-family HTH domain|nr:helix-turn-helix transcriptional regulator [Prevotella sp.]MCH3993791.1 helix-turn-helix domain-containing protein [Prevotella sp.]